MKNRIKTNNEACKRMLDVPELCEYLSMGKTRAVEFARMHGAEMRIGRRCIYDKKIIDRAIDEITIGSGTEV